MNISSYHQLEELQLVVSDTLYSCYTDLLVSAPSDEMHSYKSYRLPSGTLLTLYEDLSLVVDGTTGLRTWQVTAGGLTFV